MASLSKTYSHEKLYGKIYTPNFVVEKILDDIAFTTNSVLSKSVLDPACGDGRFLTQIAKRIIEFSKTEDLTQNLEQIHGWDIDRQAVEQCINNLNALISERKISVKWNIKVFDSVSNFEKKSSDFQTFDYIVGNPPYIRIQHLEETQRRHIQKNFEFCKSGSTDIYIAFFELIFKLLSPEGVCGLITPNTYFYTETAQPLRKFFFEQKCLRQISNYADIQLFDNVSTYSAITIFDKKIHEKFRYEHAENQTVFKERTLEISELENPKFWQLSIENSAKKTGKKLKDICSIHVGITTLADKFYIFKTEEIDENYVFALTKHSGKVRIERAILKPIIKGSLLKSSDDPIVEYVLFPFKKVEGKHLIYREKELSEQFPESYNYLLSIKDELAKRDNGKPVVPWYNFGRSQSLDTSFGRKIVFSPMNKKPNFILSENEEASLYSGYYIKYSGDAHALITQLNSEAMAKFIEISGRDFRGGWKAYNKKIVQEFPIE